MPRLFLLRHGVIVADGRFTGSRDLPLSPRGREQARFWRGELAQTQLSRAITSPLVRCRETADIIMGGRDANVETVEAFREICLGAWEGLAKAEVEARFPGALEARGADIWNYAPKDGESFAMLERRVAPALKRILATCPGNLMLVAHAGVNSVILRRWLAMPADDLFRLYTNYGSCACIDFCQDELIWLDI